MVPVLLFSYTRIPNSYRMTRTTKLQIDNGNCHQHRYLQDNFEIALSLLHTGELHQLKPLFEAARLTIFLSAEDGTKVKCCQCLHQSIMRQRAARPMDP
jgi:hypothetical protein